MSLSDSQTQKRKRSPETPTVFDSVFDFLMDFANKAETIVPQPKRRAVVVEGSAVDAHDDEQEPLENGGDGDAGESFDMLPPKEKEELLKDVIGEIAGNILDSLPEDGKEAFLMSCFDGLFPKLPRGSQRLIECRMSAVHSQCQEASPIQSAPDSYPNLVPPDGLKKVNMIVKSRDHWKRGCSASGNQKKGPPMRT